MRGWREDFLSIAAVLAVPLGFVAVFPLETVDFAASCGSRQPSAPSASIVFLDSDSVVRAMRSTRILSKRERGGVAAGADLLSAALPEPDAVPMMPIGSRDRSTAPAVVEGGIPSFLPSRRAAEPVRIPAGKDGETPPFPRTELLKLN